MTRPEPALRHLQRMTDDTSLFEHAIGSLPHRSLGYCTDDAGRGLAIAVRSQDEGAETLAERWLAFLVQAHEEDGRFRLRMGFDRHWTADPSSDDASARAIYGIGVAAASAPWPHIRLEARRLFERTAPFRSMYPRATAHAMVGAAEVLVADGGCRSARDLVVDGLASLPRGTDDERWPWPEPRLAYGNALLPEALLAGGGAVDDPVAVEEGLRLLRWLVAEETFEGRLSFTPTVGRAPDDARPAFDQQPIEAGVLADACARAFAATGDDGWLDALDLCAGWFEGRNDVGVAMFDAETGGAFDGLEPSGVNENQGAESTIALVGTLQHVAALRRRVGSGQRTARSVSNN